MDKLNRREFVEKAITSAAAAGALAVGGASLADAKKSLKIGDTIKLGKTGIKSSVLGIGTGSVGVNHSSNQTRLGHDKFNDLMWAAYDQGIRFFDLADQYGSMPYFNPALKKLDRSKIVIQTKSNNRTPDGIRADIERFRQEIGTDYLDTVLIHCVTEPDWNVKYRPIMDVLEELKHKKVIRAHGVSCHTFEALEAAANEPWVDVDLARFNPWGKYMDGKRDVPEERNPDHVKPVLVKMRKAGKGVIGMKILAQGDMAKGEDRFARARESIRFALSTGAVDMMVIGFESPQQIAEIATETRIALAEVGYKWYV
jgi:aryl-alcohol dehydrogenase-like predicted oxidoreductase